MKKLVVAVVVVIVLGAGGYAAIFLLNKKEQPSAQQTQSPAEQQFDKTRYSIDEPGSPWWIVNKNRPLPADYIPPDLRAPGIALRWAADAESMQVSSQIIPALEEMDKAMQAAGLKTKLISGYRSAEFQQQLYEGYVKSYGQQEADRISAKPGTSEHQTGLVVDLGRIDGTCELEECFGQTAEGKWLADHAHEYGFILRYPKGEEAVVGYMYEPWHFRYVGKELAAELHAQNTTMEEFFGVR